MLQSAISAPNFTGGGESADPLTRHSRAPGGEMCDVVQSHRAATQEGRHFDLPEFFFVLSMCN